MLKFNKIIEVDDFEFFKRTIRIMQNSIDTQNFWHKLQAHFKLIQLSQ
jgi:hypothetical protein